MNDPRKYEPPPQLLAGRSVLITGASSGLGRALSLAAAGAGAHVILCARNTRRLEALYDEIVAAKNPEPTLATFDFATADAQAYDGLAAQVAAQFGALDGLVHCAALLGDRTPLEQYDVPTWCKTLHVDLTAPFILTQVLAPALKRAVDGSVVFVSSSVARTPKAYWGAYSVAKAGLEALAAMLAIEWETYANLRVNTVNPGALRTPMRAAAYPAERPESVLSPALVCPLFLYLLGADSRGISGQFFAAQ